MKIGIIGVGGRTGTMFFQELKNFGEIFGIGKKEEIEKIKKRKIFIEKNKKEEIVEGNLIEEKEFPKNIQFDFLFLTVKNPVGPAVRYYYQKIKEKNLKIPILFLSQNGIEAGEEAITVLKEIFKEKTDQISVFRISLFNPIEKKKLNEKEIISYSLPIKMAMAKFFGKVDESEIFDFFKKTNFKIFFYPSKKVKDMEYSKLFLNLIGMASATRGFSPREGFLKKEVFKEEIEVIREYKKIVKRVGGEFLNFPGYPVKFYSLFFSLPPFLLFPFRKIFGKLIEKERKGKSKDLDEIDYYNGAVVRLGEKLKVQTPINKKILERVKNEKSIH